MYRHYGWGCAFFPPALVFLPAVLLTYPIYRVGDIPALCKWYIGGVGTKYDNIVALNDVIEFCLEPRYRITKVDTREDLAKLKEIPAEVLKAKFIAVYDCTACDEVKVEEILTLLLK